MNKEINRILSHELGKLGAKSAGYGSKVSTIFAIHNSSLLSKVGAYLGAGLVAKILPNNEYKINQTINADANEFLVHTYQILNSEGKIIEDIGNETEVPLIGVIVGSGYMNLNPAIVLVCIEKIEQDYIEVSVTGIAKEGLIKQYAGEKAAKRISEKLFKIIK